MKAPVVGASSVRYDGALTRLLAGTPDWGEIDRRVYTRLKFSSVTEEEENPGYQVRKAYPVPSQFVTANVVGAYSLLEFCRRMGIWLHQVGDRALPMGTSEHPHGDVDRMPLRKAHSVRLQVFQELSVYLLSRAWVELVAVRHA